MVLTRHDLARAIELETGSKNVYGAIASLLSTEHNAYGRALIEVDEKIELHPDVREEVLAHDWTTRPGRSAGHEGTRPARFGP